MQRSVRMKFEFYENGVDEVVGEIKFEVVYGGVTLENQKTGYLIGEFGWSVSRRKMGGVTALELRE